MFCGPYEGDEGIHERASIDVCVTCNYFAKISYTVLLLSIFVSGSIFCGLCFLCGRAVRMQM